MSYGAFGKSYSKQVVNKSTEQKVLFVQLCSIPKLSKRYDIAKCFVNNVCIIKSVAL